MRCSSTALVLSFAAVAATMPAGCGARTSSTATASDADTTGSTATEGGIPSDAGDMDASTSDDGATTFGSGCEETGGGNFLGTDPCTDTCVSDLPLACGDEGNLEDGWITLDGHSLDYFFIPFNPNTSPFVSVECVVLATLPPIGQSPGVGVELECSESSGVVHRELRWLFPDVVAQPFAVGEGVRLQVEFLEIGIGEAALFQARAMDDGRLLLAGTEGPPGHTREAEHIELAPLEHLEPTVCEHWSETLCDNQACLTYGAPSPCAQRIWQHAFRHGTQTLQLWPHSSGQVGPMHVLINRAHGSDQSQGVPDAVGNWGSWQTVRVGT